MKGGYVLEEDLEFFIHEVAHLVTLTSVQHTKELLMGTQMIPVGNLIKQQLKTPKGQDNNEVLTTAVTILAMERLGKGSLVESVLNMFLNLQTISLDEDSSKEEIKAARDPILLQTMQLMLRPKTQRLARQMVRMLRELESSL